MNNVSTQLAGHKTGKVSTAMRIALDIILIAVLVTLFSKNAVSLLYHEITGLVLFCLFAVHLIFNRKWIANLLRGKGAKAAKPITMKIVNVLLVLSWLAVMVTGILVSKKVFSFTVSSLNPIHFFSAALALVFTGVHFGLHWQYFWGFIGKRIRVNRVIAAVLAVIILAYGGWQVVNSSFPRWISAPFTSGGGEHGKPAQFAQEGTGDGSGLAETGEGTIPEVGSTDSGMPAGGGEHKQQAFSVLNLLNVIATYFSIVFLFAAVTHGIELILKKLKRK